jgi:hypothetical protein
MKTSEMKTRLAIAIASGFVLLAVAYWFVTWNLNRSFQKADWQKLQAVIEAPLGEVLTGKLVAQPGPGAIPYYQEHPEAVRRDQRYFEMWRSSLLIARAAREHRQAPGKWTASTDVPWISLPNRTDAWGHAFCVRLSPERTVIVSPGPQAIASLDCGTLEMTESDTARLVPNRLNVQASGALVVVVEHGDSRDPF